MLFRSWNLLQIRFFLLAVYATMYVRDHRRPLLHHAMGLDSSVYDKEVFRITNLITQQVFPVALDIDHPAFYAHLDKLVEVARAFDEAKARGGLLGKLKQGWFGAKALTLFVRLYLLPVKSQKLLENPRLRPTW